jgi:hypothetical protein
MNCVRSQTLRGVSLVTILLCAFHARLAAQDTSENLILSRTVAAIQNAEPEWKYTGALCTCEKLMKEELGVAVGTWMRPSDDSTFVSVTVYSIATVKAAARWLAAQSRNRGKNGGASRPYGMADSAILAKSADPRGFTQVEIVFRKHRFLVMVSARSEDTARWFADLVLISISN